MLKRIEVVLNWYLLYTKPRCENSVAQRLSDNGFEVLNPKFKERRYIRRKLQEVIAPLFSCYIFIKFDPFKHYHLVKYTRGLKRIVGTGNVPDVVPEEIISSLKNRMEEGIISIKPLKFEPGEEIFIKGGPLQGFYAIFEKELKGVERVSILLKAINARIVIDSVLLGKNAKKG